jgi:hypothetical protein
MVWPYLETIQLHLYPVDSIGVVLSLGLEDGFLEDVFGPADDVLHERGSHQPRLVTTGDDSPGYHSKMRLLALCSATDTNCTHGER